jgi:hypothetical protein
MTDTKITLTSKLLAVSKAIKYLEKDKTNSQQGYKYLSEAKIKEVFKKAFEDNGILFNFSTESVREYEISSTRNGAKQFVTIANGKYSFIDVDSDHELNGTWFGSGADTGDKGLYKAITGGIKYVLNTNFLIPTGDDPENDDENSNGKITAGKKAEVKKDSVKQADPDAKLKWDLLAKHNNNAAAAKKEYEEILKERQQKLEVA